jgi:hypothetical protein
MSWWGWVQEDEAGVDASTELKLAQAGGADGDADEVGDKAAQASAVRPQDVDAFWLQRQLSTHYADAVTAQRMAKSVLETLAAARDARDCENKLVLLLDYDKFDLVKLLTKNWKTVLYCTRLGQAQSAAERAAVEAEMADDPKLRAILQGAHHAPRHLAVADSILIPVVCAGGGAGAWQRSGAARPGMHRRRRPRRARARRWPGSGTTRWRSMRSPRRQRPPRVRVRVRRGAHGLCVLMSPTANR